MLVDEAGTFVMPRCAGSSKDHRQIVFQKERHHLRNRPMAFYGLCVFTFCVCLEESPHFFETTVYIHSWDAVRFKERNDLSLLRMCLYNVLTSFRPNAILYLDFDISCKYSYSDVQTQLSSCAQPRRKPHHLNDFSNYSNLYDSTVHRV